MATAMIVAVAMGSRFISYMRVKQGKGQPIRADGPVSHLSKVGTPTMGGLMILAGIAVAVFLWGDLTNPYIWIVSGVTAAFGVLGFLFQIGKRDEEGEVGVLVGGFLEASVVLLLDEFPDAVAPRLDDHATACLGIFRQVGGFDDLLVPFGKIVGGGRGDGGGGSLPSTPVHVRAWY